MKRILLFTTIIGLGLAPAMAQFGPHGGQGPNLGGSIGKLFGTNQAFSATMEFQSTGPNGASITMPGKISFDAGKSRFEMNMSEVKGAGMAASTAEQLKSMGMDQMITISRPDLKLAYVIYPGLNSYTEMVSKDPAGSASPDDYKADITELGKEAVDGHDCVKNKVTVTDKDGHTIDSTVWDAADLKNFPVKIVTGDADHPSTMTFKNISLAEPDANLFVAPAGLTKYTDVQTMMTTEMMKKMGGGFGAPPAQH
jgi:hypothetical protein